MTNTEKRESKSAKPSRFVPLVTIHFHHQHYSVTIECAAKGPVKTVMEGLKRLAAELRDERPSSLKYQVVTDGLGELPYRHIL